MFASRKRPLLLVEDRLLAVRMSLNAPVLATAEVPAGPARAAIVVHTEGTLRCFSIVIRSLRNGASAVYELEGEDLREHSGWAVALDATLSFGESMGFLFDDEMLTDRRPETLRRGLVRLHEILAPADVSDDDDFIAPAPFPVDDPGEILLEDELDQLAHGGGFNEHEATGSIAAPPPAPLGLPPVSLSRFRDAAPPVRAGTTLPPRSTAPPPSESQPPVAKPAAAPASGPATLGRVRPVRVALDPDAQARIDPLVRLLADF